MFDLDALARADARLCAIQGSPVTPRAPATVSVVEAVHAARAGDPSRCPHLAALAAAPAREMEAAG
jgi:hypothetical protein